MTTNQLPKANLDKYQSTANDQAYFWTKGEKLKVKIKRIRTPSFVWKSRSAPIVNSSIKGEIIVEITKSFRLSNNESTTYQNWEAVLFLKGPSVPQMKRDEASELMKKNNKVEEEEQSNKRRNYCNKKLKKKRKEIIKAPTLAL